MIPCIPKKSRLFAIDVDVYNDFRTNCKLLGVSMSSTVESLMIEHNDEVAKSTAGVKAHQKLNTHDNE